MKLKLLLALAVTCCFFHFSQAQLSNGSIAPDWTLTDIDGNTHTLYDYLADGKMVVLDFSATWCGPCWTFHHSGSLENLYNTYGPDGTNEVMVFMIEADASTDYEDLIGNDPASQGDWTAGTPYPIIDAPNSSMASLYQIGYWPTIYTISPFDNTIYEAGQTDTETQYSWLQSFTLDASLDQTQDAPCYGDGTASLNVSGGSAPISYSWSNGSNGPILEGVGGGNYTCTVTESNGLEQIVTDIIIEGPSQEYVVDELFFEDVACFSDASGSATVVPAGGNIGYTYAWSNGDTEATATGLEAGNYTVSIYDANNCLIEQSVTIEEPTLLESNSMSLAEACDMSNGMIEVDVTGGVEPYHISVSGPDGVFNTSELVIENLASGEYSITIEDANGCINTLSQSIDFIEGPTVEVIGDLIISCNVEQVVLEATPNGGSGDFEYLWTTDDGNIIGGDLEASSISVDQAGEYNLLLTDLETGCQSTAFADIALDDDTPTALATADNDGITCVQTQVNLSATGSSTGVDISYSWTDAQGNVISSEETVSVSEPGMYSLIVLDGENGCQSSSNVTVTDNREFVDPSYSSIVSELVVQFTDGSTGNATTWSWDFGDGMNSTEQNPVHTFLIEGEFHVCLTATNDCGSETTCTDVTVMSATSALNAFGSTVDVSCNGLNDGSIDLAVEGGTAPFEYSWTGVGGMTNTNEDLSSLVAGHYTVIITDADANTITREFDIIEPAVIVLSGISVDVFCFGESSGSLVVQAEGGTGEFSYSWDNGLTTSEIENLVAGEYVVNVTDENGCVEEIAFFVAEPDALIISSVVVEDEQSSTELGSITILVSGGVLPYSFVWSNGSTSQSLEHVEAGIYSVEITDANGCFIGQGEIEVVALSTGIEDVELSNSIKLFPNPASDFVQVDWTYLADQQLTLIVVNQLGQEIEKVILPSIEKGRFTLDVNQFNNGMYFLSFKDGEKIAVKKLFVSH